jgi:hypothetical protein
VEWGSRRDRRVDALPLPAAVRIVDAAVQTFGVVPHRIWHAQGHELATPALLKYLKESLEELNGLRVTDLEMEETERGGDNSK